MHFTDGSSSTFWLLKITLVIYSSWILCPFGFPDKMIEAVMLHFSFLLTVSKVKKPSATSVEWRQIVELLGSVVVLIF